jgi:hypothetical protein
MKKLLMISSLLPTTPRRIETVEREIGTRFPEDYREFLLRYNGGILSEVNDCFDHPVGDQPGLLIKRFFPAEDSRGNDILSRWRAYWGRVPRNLLPIGSDDFGNLFCIGFRGVERGQVFFWDHEQEQGGYVLVGEPIPADEGVNEHSIAPDLVPTEERDYWKNVFLVTTTFDTFVNELGPFEEPDV